ncbi:MAG: DUF1163 domain-containing protein [Elusimicrobia bacterium]|nr:DUF1163 domain-containing protein [Elusimicrobiota bacterium]
MKPSTWMVIAGAVLSALGTRADGGEPRVMDAAKDLGRRMPERLEDARGAHQQALIIKDVLDALEERYRVRFGPATMTPDCRCKSVGIYKDGVFRGNLHLQLGPDPRGAAFQSAAEKVQSELTGDGGRIVRVKYGDGTLADYLRLSEQVKKRSVEIDEVTGDVREYGRLVGNFKAPDPGYKYYVSVVIDGPNVELVKVPVR